MEKNHTVLIVEGEEGKLFQAVRQFQVNLEVDQTDFLKAKEVLSHTSPYLVILNVEHQKVEAKEILKTFSPTLHETFWAVTAPEMATEELVDFMRLGVIDFLKQPLNEKGLYDFIQRIENLTVKKVPKQSHNGHQLISFFSSKGGVGVSFAAVNFAVGIAKRNLGRVLLVDFVLQHGNIADFLDLVPQFTLLDVAKNLERLDTKLLENSLQKHRSGVYVLPHPKQPEDSECFSTKLTIQVLNLLKKSFDYVLLDVGHELNATTLACLDLSDLIFTVTTPDLPSVLNTSLALQTFEKLGYSQDKVKLILNRWRMKGEINTSSIEKNVSYPVCHKLREDSSVVLASLNQGVPLIEFSKKSKLVRSFEELTRLLSNGIKKEKQKWPFRKD